MTMTAPTFGARPAPADPGARKQAGLRAGLVWAALALTLAAMATIPVSAHAASAAAWEELWKKAQAACFAASGLSDAKMLGKPTDFSDRVLVLVRGRWPQPHMQDAPPATFACLYAKTSGKAEATEMPHFND